MIKSPCAKCIFIYPLLIFLVGISICYSDNGFWRLDLPIQLRNRQHFKRIELGNSEVFLLGTSHVSTDSCDDVRALMHYLKPDVLFVELCPQRIPILFQDEEEASKSEESAQQPSTAEVENAGFFQTMKTLQENGMSRTGALSTILLTKVQGDYAGKLGVRVGQEFKEAYECALMLNMLNQKETNSNKNNGVCCRVVLGDRPVRLTLVRAWESLKVFGKMKLVLYLLWSSLKQPSEEELRKWMEDIMKDGDLLTASIKELSETFPSIGKVIIKERDAYMFAKLKQTASLGPRRILAVVGAGHCEGIYRLAKDDNINETSAQKVLKEIIETKHWKIEDNEEMRALTTDVIELQVT